MQHFPYFLKSLKFKLCGPTNDIKVLGKLNVAYLKLNLKHKTLLLTDQFNNVKYLKFCKFYTNTMS